MKPVKTIGLLFATALLLSSCKKYLDAKPDKQLVIANKINDYQALLDNTNIMTVQYPSAGEVASDDLYLLYNTWQTRTVTDQNCYTWQADVFNDDERNDWSNSYLVVYYANLVLDGIKSLPQPAAGSDISNVEGQAHFFRAFAFYNVLQLFAKPYDASHAEEDLGIPLRLSSDLNIPTSRSTVKQSYDQVLADAKQAAMLLPVTPLVKTRPCRTAAYALLARTYLSMSDYVNAKKFADSALSICNTLIDYNCTCINPNAAYPFPLFNDEVIFHSLLYGVGALSASAAKVDSNLYRSYDANDWRKTAFFKKNADGTISFKGSYNGSSAKFCGFAVDELFLVRAECNVRLLNVEDGLNDLNTLLARRWKQGTFVPLATTDPKQALQLILLERRKELLFRGLRWSDLRRLNKEPEFAVTITRNLNGTTYTLPPNDTHYVFPIPLNVINITGIQQN
jgi:hypothetical protein